MAFFSRRVLRQAQEPDRQAQEPDRQAQEPDRQAQEPDSAADEAVPVVGISVTAYGAPAAAEDEPASLRDNALLRDALATLTEEPEPLLVMQVARQLMQQHLFLRVKGDARALLAAGADLPLAALTFDDGRYLVAYSSGAAVQRSIAEDGDVDTSAMGQPVMAVLAHLLSGEYAGIVLDPSSAPARLVLPRSFVERMVAQADPALTVKSLLAQERTPQLAAAVAEALTRVPHVFVAVGASEPDEHGVVEHGVAETRDEEGRRILELYSHPLEVVAMDRGDQPAPLEPAQLAALLREDEGIAGVVIDAAGPWLRLDRAELAPVLALAR